MEGYKESGDYHALRSDCFTEYAVEVSDPFGKNQPYGRNGVTTVGATSQMDSCYHRVTERASSFRGRDSLCPV